MKDDWIAAQSRHCTKAMEASISATHLCMTRGGFSHDVTPARGSVVASPVMAHWDPEPDYFFNWFRDAAIVMDAVTILSCNAQTAIERKGWNDRFRDYVSFNLGVNQIDGNTFLRHLEPENADAAYRQYLRPAAEFMTLRPVEDTRINPDGTPDRQKWSRPQYDGAALRALACLRHRGAAVDQGRRPSKYLDRLIRHDLDLTLARADAPCIGIWEEKTDQHYYTGVVQLGALHHGAGWAHASGDNKRHDQYQQAAETLRAGLDSHWDERGFYKASRNMPADDPEACLDSAVILAVNHARLPASGRHSVGDPRVQASFNAIGHFFAKEFPINLSRPGDQGLAIGRYKGDDFQGGGAFYFSTLGFAEFCYRRAALGGPVCRNLLRQGDQIMRTVAKTGIPEDGSLSEQFDRVSGQQISARNLAWSSAAFISAAAAREKAFALIGPEAKQFHQGIKI